MAASPTCSPRAAGGLLKEFRPCAAQRRQIIGTSDRARVKMLDRGIYPRLIVEVTTGQGGKGITSTAGQCMKMALEIRIRWDLFSH